MTLVAENPDVMYRLLVQGVVDYAIYMLTPEGIVANWNSGAQRAKQYKAGEIVGKHFSLFYSPEDRERNAPMKALQRARDNGRFEAQGWRMRKDGSTFWAHVVIEAVHDDEGELIGFSKITRDITERRQAELEILAAKELAERYSEKMAALSRFLDSVIGSIPASVVVQDANTREILLVNEQAQRLFGTAGQDGQQPDMVGKQLHECMPLALADYVREQTDQCMHSATMRLAEDRLRTAIGPRVLRTKTLLRRDLEAQSDYVLLIAEDVTDEIAAREQIHHMAHHDALTGLANRTLLHEQLENALRDSLSHKRLVATLCLDLDKFKNVNDAFGHAFGDKLLRAVAERLRGVLRDEDTLARLGGDEFAIILPRLEQPEDAYRTARRIIECIAPAFMMDGHNFLIGVSIGIAFTRNARDTGEHLLGHADMALYEAKRNGRNRFEVFHQDMAEAAQRRRIMEIDLRKALHLGQLQLYYQPIVGMDDTRITGYEALMRWQHPTKGLIMPLDFIPIAEETGLIHEVGARALNLACQEACSWGTEQSVAVNLSPAQFKNRELVSIIKLALDDSGLAPQRLELEITESVLLENNEENINTLRALKELGVGIALDDFGTGYSSLGYLRSFPFDRIKIDKSFVHEMEQSREAMSIIRAITGISSSLLIKTTAEGVETQEQFARLKAEGCSHLQGYLFGRPSPIHERKREI